MVAERLDKRMHFSLLERCKTQKNFCALRSGITGECTPFSWCGKSSLNAIEAVESNQRIHSPFPLKNMQNTQFKIYSQISKTPTLDPIVKSKKTLTPKPAPTKIRNPEPRPRPRRFENKNPDPDPDELLPTPTPIPTPKI